MDRRLRDGQLTVKRSHRVTGNRRKKASDLDIYLERVTGIEPALSAWEVCGVADVPAGITARAPARPGPDDSWVANLDLKLALTPTGRWLSLAATAPRGPEPAGTSARRARPGGKPPSPSDRPAPGRAEYRLSRRVAGVLMAAKAAGQIW